MSTNAYPVFFDSELLNSSVQTYYTVPNSPTSIILQEMQLKFTNTTGATRTVTAYAVPNAETVGAQFAIASNISVPPYDYIILPVHRLGANGTIQAFADASDAVLIQPIGGKLHTP